MNKQSGFNLVELLIVIAILGILITLVIMAVQGGKQKAFDNSIRNDVRQMRWLAEEVYDSNGASYEDWTQNAEISAQLDVLHADMDKILNYIATPEQPHAAILRESQVGDYCISAPLKTDSSSYYCVDATGVFSTFSSPCPDNAKDGDPLRCPAS
ncbi:MAG: type II secretion system protein [bacterium]|nr:type II secretion system protein [bacterium]MDZ4346528.1 type II secretion system protein [Candidatus Binatia bacterium]